MNKNGCLIIVGALLLLGGIPTGIYFLFKDNIATVYCPLCEGRGKYATYTHQVSYINMGSFKQKQTTTFEYTHDCDLCNKTGIVSKAMYYKLKPEADRRKGEALEKEKRSMGEKTDDKAAEAKKENKTVNTEEEQAMAKLKAEEARKKAEAEKQALLAKIEAKRKQDAVAAEAERKRQDAIRQAQAEKEKQDEALAEIRAKEEAQRKIAAEKARKEAAEKQRQASLERDMRTDASIAKSAVRSLQSMDKQIDGYRENRKSTRDKSTRKYYDDLADKAIDRKRDYVKKYVKQLKERLAEASKGTSKEEKERADKLQEYITEVSKYYKSHLGRLRR